MPDIVISEFMDEAAVESLNDGFSVLYDPGLVDRPDALQAALGEARALIVRNRTRVTAPLLTAAPRLEAVGRLGVGLDNIDMAACRTRGVQVFPATGANDLAVAEYAIAAALMLLRGAYHAGAAMLAGAWPRQDLIGREAAGKTLGLVGFGGIARQVAARARALGMNVAACDPFVAAGDAAWQGVARHETLDSLLPACDVLSLHVPLTEGTRNLIDARALAASLRAGPRGGAALDVFAEEPLGAPAASRFAGLSNVILTPHIAGVTAEANVRVSALTAEQVRRALGEPK